MKEGTAASRALRYCASGVQRATTLCLALPGTRSGFEPVSRMALITACWPLIWTV